MADVMIVGQIASLAARLMTPISQKLTGLFFDEVRKRIETPTAPSAEAAVAAPAPAAPEAAPAGLDAAPAALEAAPPAPAADQPVEPAAGA
jgi:hypothetical protein